MATKKSNKTITQLFGSIAAAQTMVEQFPFSFGVNENGFTCTFDLLTSIFNIVSDEPLEEMVVKTLTENLSDTNNSWLQNIEETVKLAIEANLTNIVTCEMSPIIPDRLIGAGEFLELTDRTLSFSGEGVIVPASAIDFTGLLGYCPADEVNPVATANYFPCYNTNGEPLSVNDLWKHDDFNAFLWFVKNKGVYGNTIERNKLIWDNRYKTKPYTRYERKDEKFFTMSTEIDPKREGTITNGVFPFDKNYLNKYNEHSSTKYKKRQILECRYIDGDGIHSDSFQFKLAASNYYKSRKLTGPEKISSVLQINKTIFEFNHDFLMSLKLYDPKTYLCQMVSSLLGEGNVSFNFSITRNTNEIEQMIDGIITKVINLDDTEVNDCYYTFSNEEYDLMLQETINKRIYGAYNRETTNRLMDEIYGIDISNPDKKVENRLAITNVLNQLTKEVSSGENTVNGWKLNYNYQFELIRMLVYPLIRPLFSPKVMTLILINFNIMGDPIKFSKKVVSWEDLKPYFMNIITNIIIQIKDIINEMLYSWVIKKLTPMLTMFTLRVLMEQVEMYRTLINDMLIACADFPSFNRNNKNKFRVGIDVVDYAEIDPELEKLKQTPITNSNC